MTAARGNRLRNVQRQEKRVVTLPVPRRCVFLRLRLEGQGDMVLYSVTPHHRDGDGASGERRLTV